MVVIESITVKLPVYCEELHLSSAYSESGVTSFCQTTGMQSVRGAYDKWTQAGLYAGGSMVKNGETIADDNQRRQTMTTILVTGGTGTLGRDVVAELKGTAHSVRLMSRQPAPPGHDNRVQWAQADLLTGAGLAEAVREVNVIVNCASSPAAQTYETDVTGTRRLLDAAKAAGVSNFLHVSIVGIDRINRPYYQYKLAAERVIAESGLPYSNLRVTQFHSYVDRLLRPLSERPEPELLVPVEATFQPIDSREAARALLQYATPEGHGPLADVGGPQVLDLGTLARTWLDARGDHRPIVDSGIAANHTTLTPEQAEGFSHGYNTTANMYGAVTWEMWVMREGRE